MNEQREIAKRLLEIISEDEPQDVIGFLGVIAVASIAQVHAILSLGEEA